MLDPVLREVRGCFPCYFSPQDLTFILQVYHEIRYFLRLACLGLLQIGSSVAPKYSPRAKVNFNLNTSLCTIVAI